MRLVGVVLAVVLTAGSSFAQHGMDRWNQRGGRHSYGGHSHGSRYGGRHAQRHAPAPRHHDAPHRDPDASKADKNKGKKSDAARKEFMEDSGYPKGRPGYVIDYIIPLKEGGTDAEQNMRWRTADADDASATPKARGDKATPREPKATPSEPKATPSDEPRRKRKAPVV